jgi:metal-responsive CopG/Arc/MetJ family transcriptional regulator
MVTVYLPPALVEQLDRAWLERRMQDRKVQKSHIVAEALETYLQS